MLHLQQVNRPGRPAGRQTRGFTLVEMLVVIAVTSLLLGILLPALSRGRITARIVRAHAELRQVDHALELYRMDNHRHLPPTRFSCSTRTAYDLPDELAENRYLPGIENERGDTAVKMPDIFNEEQSYRYRAPGPALQNESPVPNGTAMIWVPDDMPTCLSESGRYYDDQKSSPVRYAIWSVGPDPLAPNLQHIPGRGPIPARFWCRGASEPGFIVHFEDSGGAIHTSP